MGLIPTLGMHFDSHNKLEQIEQIADNNHKCNAKMLIDVVKSSI